MLKSMRDDEAFGSENTEDPNDESLTTSSGISGGVGSEVMAKEDDDSGEDSESYAQNVAGESGESSSNEKVGRANVSVMSVLGGGSEGSYAKPEKRTLFTVFVVLALVLTLVVGCLVFSSKSVVGAWKLDRNNNNKGVAALVLNSDGTAEYTTGSYAITGNYKCDGGKLTLAIDGANEISGVYDYRVAAGLADKSMELINSEGKGVILKQYNLERSVNPVSGFSAKKEVLGKWTSASDSGVIYEFKDDGLMIVTSNNITLTYTYFVNDNTIDLMQYPLRDSADEASRSSVGYVVKDGVFKMGGMVMTRVD